MWVFYICAGLVVILAAIIYIPFLFDRIFNVWLSDRSPEDIEKYRVKDVRVNIRESCRSQFRGRLKKIFLVVTTGLFLGAVLAFTGEGGQVIRELDRPGFGEGETEVELEAEIGESTCDVVVRVNEVKPGQEDLDSFFAAVSETALVQILGDNENLSHVCSNLNLIRSLDGVKFTWQSPEPELISSLGVIGQDIPEEGRQTWLVMTMTYGDYSKSYKVPMVLYPRLENSQDSLSDYISSRVADSSPDSYVVQLPAEYEGKELVLRRKKDNSGQNLVLLVLVAALLIWISEGSRLEDSYAKRNRELETDYPDIVSRLSILLSAGLSIPAAWMRLCEDYEKELSSGKKRRSGYEEMRLTALELSNTGYTASTFHSFGARCGNYRYMRLSDVLEQSMKKGTLQLSQYMEQEALQAFELKKMQAARAGEEAGTKLLIPMMMMFGLIIAMVVVPAWNGMKL